MAKTSPANWAARLTSCSDAEKKSGEIASPVVGLRARKAALVPAPSVNPIIDCPESFIENTANRILESRTRRMALGINLPMAIYFRVVTREKGKRAEVCPLELFRPELRNRT